MSRRSKQLVVMALAFFLFALTAVSALQVTNDTELVPTAQEAEVSINPGDLCQNVFIACGGYLACPGGCYCADIGTGSGLCLKN